MTICCAHPVASQPTPPESTRACIFLQNRFKKDDLNGDGTITLEEMQAPLLNNRLLQDNSTKMALRKKLVQGRFEKLDRDNSGVLGEDEYTAIFDGGDQANELVH